MVPQEEAYWFNQLKANAQGYNDRIDTIKKMLINKRGYYFEKPEGEHVILLYSGGVDSTTLIDLVASKWNAKIILLYIRRGSRNQQYEENAVDFFYDFYKNRYPDNIIDLVKIETDVPTRVNKEYFDKNRRKVMGYPMRNSIMWSLGVSQAVYLGEKYETTIRTVLVGSVGDDSDSPESGYLSVLSMSLHACICLGTWNFQVNAPLMDNSFKVGGMFKKDLVAYCRQNDIPIEKSRSCFEASEEPCGQCLACIHRMKAFQEAK